MFVRLFEGMFEKGLEGGLEEGKQKTSESVSECITRCIRNIKASEYISDTHRQAPHKYRTTDYSQQMRQTSDRCMTRQSSHNKPAQETQHS